MADVFPLLNVVAVVLLLSLDLDSDVVADHYFADPHVAAVILVKSIHFPMEITFMVIMAHAQVAQDQDQLNAVSQ
jgi:hypothetical protein